LEGWVVKRFVAVLAVVGLAVFGLSPRADAVGYGACTIVGTISFSSQTVTAGTWTIGPATLDCQGVIGKRARIIGRGPLRGSGTYSALPPGNEACLRQTGTGNVAYEIPTASGKILVKEPENHTLAGAGVFDTPTLRGPFQLSPPYDGDCLTKPVSRASFVAQVLLYRHGRAAPPALPKV
jgi:hypothetical protein